MDRLGIDFITIFSLPPVDYVNLAADVGIKNISIVLNPLDYNPEGYRRWSLKDNPQDRKEMIAAMRDRGVSIALGEGFIVAPGGDVRKDYPRDLELMHELGCRRINTITFDPDVSRSMDQFALMAEMAAAAGVETVGEFAPVFSVVDLPMALAAKKHVGRKDFRVLLDTMHLSRTGGTAADIAALPPDTIGYVQLCDADWKATIPDYMEEAMYERKAPGDGQFPLRDIVNAVPRDIIVSVEVPLRSEAEKGIKPHDRVKRIIKQAREMMSRLDS